MPDTVENHTFGAPVDEAAGSGASAEVVLRVQHLAKAFGPTQALRDLSLELRRGEVLSIMGENASGKSTLVKILSGVHRPDGGTIELAGKPLVLHSPQQAQAVGIATVFQEILVVPQQPVLTNIWLGTDGLVRRRVPLDQRRTRGRAVLAELLDEPALQAPAGSLSLSDRQAVCVARALVREPRILILDEATSTLDVATRDRLFTIIRRLRAAGTGILFISHRMEEVEEIADRVTIVRSGEDVATLRRGEADAQRMVALMTGVKEAGQELRQVPDARTRVQDDVVVVRVRGVRLHHQAATIEAEIRAGELIGVAGLEGHGQDRFLRVLAGVTPADGEVVCLTDGQAKALRSPADALASGIAYVPQDRRGEGIFETRSILENFQVATLGMDRRRGLLRRSLTEGRFDRYADLMRIVTGHRSNVITSLSGGTQQKVMIARWLATDPRVLLLNDPTRGVDVGTKNDIYGVLADAASRGVAVVMLSTEVIELVELMDRVLVFREGELHRELYRGEFSRARLVASYFGRDAE